MLKFSIDISNEKEFNETFKQYMNWQKRQPAEIVNGKLYFIALQAMRQTRKADQGEIESNLRASSKNYPGVPLVSILINKQLSEKNKKGLSGEAMAVAMEKYIKKAQSRIQFLRSGWLPALKKLDYYNKRNLENLKFTKRFAPKRPEGIKQYGKDKGTAINALPDRERVWGSISNFVGKGKQASPTVVPILLEGLNKAVREEIRSMNIYIERKFREQFQRMRATGKA